MPSPLQLTVKVVSFPFLHHPKRNALGKMPIALADQEESVLENWGWSLGRTRNKFSQLATTLRGSLSLTLNSTMTLTNS